MPQSLAKNAIHLVFSTKERRAYLNEAVRADLHAYMSTVLKNMDCPALIINSVPDHIHLLFLLHRTKALSNVVGDLKKTSSKWMKTKSTQLQFFTWQAGFGAFSVSESNIPAVRKYIQNQQEHHKKISFEDEFRTLLRKHRMEYDECYLWD